MDTKVYVCAHKKFNVPEDPTYLPIHVGSALSNDLGYLRDDGGDNISRKNASYCELTGIYYLWKNVSCDIIGICHYRRYFVEKGDLLKKERIEEILGDYDLILARSEFTKYRNLETHYGEIHIASDLKKCRDVIEKLCPEYLRAFDLCMNCNLFNVGNMMVCKKELFDSYCQWLFAILDETEKVCDISEYDTFQARLFGYFAERLLRVWVLHNHLKVYETKVDLVDTETGGRNIKDLSRNYFDKVLLDFISLYKQGQDIDVAPAQSYDIDLQGKIPVWVFRWEEEDKLSKLSTLCAMSHTRHFRVDKFILINLSMENIGNFLDLPPFIIEKFEQGIISPDDMAEIFAASLIYRYGGLWVDKEYLLTQDFPDRYLSDRDFFSLKTPTYRFDLSICDGRYDYGFLYGNRGSRLFRFLLQGLYTYWDTQDRAISPEIGNYIIDCACRHFPEMGSALENIEMIQESPGDINSILDLPFNKERFKDKTGGSFIFKINTLENVSDTTIFGEETTYSYLKNTFTM